MWRSEKLKGLYIRYFLTILLGIFCLSGFTKDLFWVGGSGNWSDASHWSLSSGGLGGAGIPTTKTSVFFDAASFTFLGQTVQIDKDAQCYSLVWIKNHQSAVITGGAPTELHISGSIELAQSSRFLFNGKLLLTSKQTSNIIQPSNTHLLCDIVLDGGGEWDLRSNLFLSKKNSIHLVEGNFNSNGYAIFCKSFVSKGNAKRILNLSTSLLKTSEEFTLEKHKDLAVIASDARLVTARNAVVATADYELLSSARGPEGDCSDYTFTDISTNPTCNDSTNGIAAIWVQGGSGNFTYLWTTVPASTDSFALGQGAGTPSVIVTDVDSGTICVVPVSLVEPAKVLVTPIGATRNPTCNGLCNGRSQPLIIPSGGTGPGTYTFQWDNAPTFETTAVATSLCVGTSILTVTDLNGCTGTHTVVLTEPDSVQANVTLTPVTCPGGADGQAASAPLGGNGPAWTYTWGPGVYPNAASIGSLTAGNYTLRVTDFRGCFKDTSFAIVEPPPISATASITDLLCNGACIGEIDITASGGTPPYTAYQWNDSNHQAISGATAALIQNLCAGSYWVEITDSQGCLDSVEFTITEPPELVSSISSYQATCNNVCDGGANVVSVTGGAPGYLYEWHYSNGGLIPTPPGQDSVALICGDSTVFVIVEDFNGCIDTSNFVTIPNPDTISATVAVTSNFNGTTLSCHSSCDGEITISPVIGGTPFVLAPYYILELFMDGAFDQILPDTIVTSLCAGDYFIVATDSMGCTDTSNVVTIEPPDTLETSLAPTDVTCYGLDDGILRASSTGGTPPYDYQFYSGAPPLGLPLASNPNDSTAMPLPPGDYYVIATDTNGCKDTAYATILEPDSLIANITAADVICPGDCDGSVTAAPTGGTAPYNFQWFTGPLPTSVGDTLMGQTAALLAALCPGEYYVVVMDDRGCVDTSLVDTVFQPDTLLASVVFADVTCSYLCDGTGHASPTGGTPPYVVDWIGLGPPQFNSTNDDSLMVDCAGEYYAFVTDNAGCTVNSDTITISAPDTIQSPITITSNYSGAEISCNGECDGTALVNASGGVPATIPPPYTYQWLDAGMVAIPWERDSTIDSLCADTYYVIVLDSNLCRDTSLVTLTEPDSLLAPIVVSNVICFGEDNGEITVFPSGGTPGYSYQWHDAAFPVLSPLPGETSPTLLGAAPGLYYVYVVDANLCDTVSVDVTVTQPDSLALDTASVNHNTICGGPPCDGSITVTYTGGSGIPDIYWYASFPFVVPIDSGLTADSLCPGTYYVVATDTNNCTDVDTVVIFDGVVVAVDTFLVTDPTCYGLGDGVAWVYATGGATPHTFAWYNSLGPPLPVSFSSLDSLNLSSGTYYVIATDNNSCESPPLQIDLFDPDTITTITDSINNICSTAAGGTAIVIAAGGTQPYNYLWQHDMLLNNDTASGLPSGTYVVTVGDANGCPTVKDSIVITAPPPLDATFNVVNVACFGDTTGSATVLPTGGTPGTGPIDYTYLWNTGPNDTLATLNNLASGVLYSVTVTDSLGCDSVFFVQLTENDSLHIVTTFFDPNDCFGDSTARVQVAVSGGYPGTAGYTFTWDPAPLTGQGTNFATGLYAGVWSVLVVDSVGCMDSLDITIVDPDSITIVLDTVIHVSCNTGNNGSATVIASGGTPGYTYQWYNSMGSPVPFGQAATVLNLAEGTYNVQVEDIRNCSNTLSVTVTDPPPLTVAVDTAINVSCPGGNDGLITVIAGGGTPGYDYSWVHGGTLPTTALLGAGEYIVTITDTLNCTLTDTFVLAQPDSIYARFSNVTASLCAIASASATIIVDSGGTPGYSFVWVNAITSSPTGDTLATADSLASGTYYVIITDTIGCQDSSYFITISDTTSEDIMLAVTENAICRDSCSGMAEVSFNCSDPPCIVYWNYMGIPFDSITGIVAGQDTFRIANLCPDFGAADYSVGVRNASECDTVAAFSITAPPIVVPNRIITTETCRGDNTGTIEVNPTGGNGGFTYQWTEPPSPFIFDFDTMMQDGAGTYNVRLLDAMGCDTSFTFTIPPIPALIIDTITASGVTCYLDTNGIATVLVLGGTPLPGPTYVFQWFTTSGVPVGQNVSSQPNLGAGNYFVEVTDAIGCVIQSDSVTVAGPDSISAVLTPRDISCYDLCNGRIDAVASGGSGVYVYQWLDFASTPIPLEEGDTIANICIGDYSVQITDNNGCTGTSPVGTIGSPDYFSITANGFSTTCFNNCEGIAVALVDSGGTPAIFPLPPYTYSWNSVPVQNGDSAFNLCPGTYDVTILDGQGCDTVVSVIIAAPTMLNPSENIAFHQNVNCFGASTGQASVSVSGGTGPYDYRWIPVPGTGNDSSAVGAALAAGNWDVTVTDSRGCDSTIRITILQNPQITLVSSSINPASCGNPDGTAAVNITGGAPIVAPPPANYNYSWAPSGGTNNQTTPVASGLYTVTVTDRLLCNRQFVLAINDIGAETITTDTIPVICFGDSTGGAIASFTCADPPCVLYWIDGAGDTIATSIDTLALNLDTLLNIPAGTYLASVENNIGCIAFASSIVPQSSDISIPAGVTNPLCNGDCLGTILISPAGGMPYAIGEPYRYVWRDTLTMTIFDTLPYIDSLCAGGYVVQVFDSLGCMAERVFSITESDSISVPYSSIDNLCFGGNNGVINLTPIGGTGILSYNWSSPNGGTGLAINNQDQTGLSAATYQVVVTDANACVADTVSIIILEPADSVVLLPLAMDLLCNGGCDGIATITASGGTPSGVGNPYTYQWFIGAAPIAAPAGTNDSLFSRCAGSYGIIGTDANNCSSARIEVTLTEPSPIAPLTSNATNINCFGGACTGTVSISVGGGTAPYNYQWLASGLPFGPDTSFVNLLCAQQYGVIVTDSNNCVMDTVFMTVGSPTQITATFPVIDSALCGLSDGFATVSPVGGAALPYNYLWNDPLAQTTQTATNLAAGLYNVLVSNPLGCVRNFAVFIPNINGPIVMIDSILNPICFGALNGAVYISAAGPNPIDPFAGYTWTGPGGYVGFTQDISGLAAGGYDVIVTDDSGCVAAADTMLVQPTLITNSWIVLPASCGDCNGELIVSSLGGTGGYTYNWSNGDIGALADSLCASIVSVSVTDANGCNVVSNIPVSNVNAPFDSIPDVIDATCADRCDGAINPTMSSGATPYTFFWSHNSSTVLNQAGLCAGNYNLEVTDTLNCIRNISYAIGTLSPPFADSIIIFPSTCGDSTGRFELYNSNALPDYIYQWGVAAGSVVDTGLFSIVANLPSGIYNVSVTDAAGCDTSYSRIIPNIGAPILTGTHTNLICNGDSSGSISVTVAGGDAPYIYNWSTTTGGGLNYGLGDTTIQTGLAAGSYMLQVTDITPCSSLLPITLTQPPGFTFSPPAIFNVLCPGDANGSAVIPVSGGTLPYTAFRWNDPLNQSTAAATNLPAGTFMFKVTDSRGCQDSAFVTLAPPSPMFFTSLSTTDASCTYTSDGQIAIGFNGGAVPYTYSWIGPGGFTATTQSLNAVGYGPYSLVITDNNGCTIDTAATIFPLNEATAYAGEDREICVGENATLLGEFTGVISGVRWDLRGGASNPIATVLSVDVSPPVGVFTYIFMSIAGSCTTTDSVVVTVFDSPFADAGPDLTIPAGDMITIGGVPTGPAGATYLWLPGRGFEGQIDEPNPFYNAVEGTINYIVRVTDINGCINTDTVKVIALPDIIIPNGITPNGDGSNEVWIIDYLDEFPNAVVQVYNRWGELLFQSTSALNQWDGTYNGKILPVGTYYYVIELNDDDFPEPITGPITLMR